MLVTHLRSFLFPSLSLLYFPWSLVTLQFCKKSISLFLIFCLLLCFLIYLYSSQIRVSMWHLGFYICFISLNLWSQVAFIFLTNETNLSSLLHNSIPLCMYIIFVYSLFLSYDRNSTYLSLCSNLFHLKLCFKSASIFLKIVQI